LPCFTEPPDIAVEIVSPHQSVTQQVRRCVWYVANGVSVALLVDPSDKSVLVFRPGREMLALHGSEGVDLGDIVPGLTLTAQELFDALKL
jgi:Uma2 family endonuclease